MDTAKVSAQYLESCGERGLAMRTIEKYRWGLEFLVEECRKLPKHGADLIAVVTRPEHGPQTRKKLRIVLSTFFRWCGRRYEWPNPVLELERMPRSRRRLPRVLSKVEVRNLLAACESRRDRALVVLVLETGLRLSEVAALKWEDVRPDYIRVTDSKSDDRAVPLSEGVKRMLVGLGDGQNIWMGRKGPMTRSGIQNTYRRLFKMSYMEGPKLGAHLLRHTFATQYIAGGGNVFSLKEILGHDNISTTQIYVTLAMRQVSDDHRRFSPVVTWGLLEAVAD